MIIHSNGNVGIGTTNPFTKLQVNGILNTSNGLAVPSTGSWGGLGDRIIFSTGGTGIHPYSIGMNTNVLWYSVPSTGAHNFYANGAIMLTINSTAVSVATLNATTTLQEGGVNLSSKYLPLGGGTIASGNLGIGTNSAQTRLDVRGVINCSNGFLLPSSNTAYGSNGNRIILNAGTAGSVYPFSIGMNTNTMWFSVPTNGRYVWYSNLTSNMYLDNTGSLNVFNDITAFTSASDVKLKTNIKPLNMDCIDLINKLKPVEFTWKEMDLIPNNRKNTIDHGFIAQEVEELLPHLIRDTRNYKTIRYEKFSPYIIKAIQELIAKIDKNNIIIDVKPDICMFCKCINNKILKNIPKIEIGNYIHIIDSNKNGNKYKIIDINENEITIDNDLQGNGCYVYGKYTDDYETFNKDYIYKLNITISKQQEQINNLTEKITELTNLFNTKFNS